MLRFHAFERGFAVPRLADRALKFAQERFPQAPVLFNSKQFIGPEQVSPKDAAFLVVYDVASGMRQSILAIEDFGSHCENEHFAQSVSAEFANLMSSVAISGGNKLTGHIINDSEMVNSPRLIIYTDNLAQPRDQMLAMFAGSGQKVDILVESEMYYSVFVSYGAPDEKHAKAIVKYLKTHGVKTFLFCDDAIPGQKLHRMMWEGVEQFDRVILVCSSSSLLRPGEMNEIERALEREARDGGTGLLIPITIDRFVFDQWKPQQKDLAAQVRSRVIAIFPSSARSSKSFASAAEKLLSSLKR